MDTFKCRNVDTTDELDYKDILAHGSESAAATYAEQDDTDDYVLASDDEETITVKVVDLYGNITFWKVHAEQECSYYANKIEAPEVE